MAPGEPSDRFETTLRDEAVDERCRRLSHELELKLIRSEDAERHQRFLELMLSGFAENG
jgi:hypothetical protein